MTSPPSEGEEKVGPRDRARYRDEALSIATRLGSTGLDEQGIWQAYAETEKLIAVLKFRLGYETPGVFTKLPDAGDRQKLVKEAAELLSRSAEEMEGGRLFESIETLRSARNGLRSLLTPRRGPPSRAERPSDKTPRRRAR